jgi:hypothetical protein
MHRLEADYLVVGCGAAAMAFTDALIAASDDARVVIVDRRHAPGGHWLDAYPFVRLHQPSTYYGVNSLPLGSEAIDQYGPNQGLYERATAPEICAYYSRVMEQCLLPSGRVRYFPMCDYRESHGFASRVSNQRYEVDSRAKLVDATYLQAAVPASTPPPFEVAPEARCVPINELARLTEPPEGYVIIGGGKTAIDACLWLLEIGVAPSDIRWIRPREGWWVNREYTQGGELVGRLLEGLSFQLEAAARATSLDDLFRRLNDAGQLAPDRGRRAAGPRAVHRTRRDRTGGGQDRHQPAAPARPLRGARTQPGARRADLFGGPHHAPADPRRPHSVQRRPGRLRRGDASRRAGEEPPLPSESPPQRPARLGAQSGHRHERRLSVVEGARHRRLAGALAAERQSRPAGTP